MAKETTFTFRVDDELKAAFTRAAAAHDRSGSQLLRDFMRAYIRDTARTGSDQALREDWQAYDSVAVANPDHDAWFRERVREGLADSRPTIPHDQVAAEIREVIERVVNAR
ncbi:MAG TPA: hypothetical protein VFK96_05775 [Gammaproteobacteria bacterium]|nr:hypothetical protein [Gammaproteobacteria bacterium]